MANITRYSPFDDLFQELSRGYFVKPLGFPQEADLQIRLDVKEDDKAYTVHAEIPGVRKEDIHVDVNGSQLTIRAESRRESEKKEGEKVLHSERSYGAVSRTLSLPAEIDSQGANAQYKDGVLELRLPKTPGAQARRLDIH